MLAWRWERAGLRDTNRRSPILRGPPRRALRWPVDSGFETAGELLFAGKTTASFDALVQGKLIDVRKLAVQDEQSNVQMSLRRRKGVLEGSFSGDAGRRLAGSDRADQAVAPDARERAT